jgi:hypothetical protein
VTGSEPKSAGRKKSALKLLMPMQSLAHQGLEFWIGFDVSFDGKPFVVQTTDHTKSTSITL